MEEKKDNTVEENLAEESEKDYFKDLIENEEDEGEKENNPDDNGEKSLEDMSEDERREFNKNAEEKRKRLEAEAKAKKEAKEKAKKEAEEKAKKEAEEKEKKEAESNGEKKLGKELADFTKKYPDVSLKKLDEDEGFKIFIKGKLLGKQTFSELYEDYFKVIGGKTGKDKKELEENYRKKANAGTGSSQDQGGNQPPQDVYQQNEMQDVLDRIPLMNDADAAEALAKLERSEKYYKK